MICLGQLVTALAAPKRVRSCVKGQKVQVIYIYIYIYIYIIVGVWGKMTPKTSNERKTLAGRALSYAKLRHLSHCA